jgi:hypothetical protein
MKKPAHNLIAEVPRRQAKLEMTIGIDLGDVRSHYCTLNQDGEAVDRGRFRATPKAIEKSFTDIPPAHIAMLSRNDRPNLSGDGTDEQIKSRCVRDHERRHDDDRNEVGCAQLTGHCTKATTGRVVIVE